MFPQTSFTAEVWQLYILLRDQYSVFYCFPLCQRKFRMNPAGSCIFSSRLFHGINLPSFMAGRTSAPLQLLQCRLNRTPCGAVAPPLEYNSQDGVFGGQVISCRRQRRFLDQSERGVRGPLLTTVEHIQTTQQPRYYQRGR